MKEEALKEFVDNVIQERMQSAFSQMKAGKKPDDEDDVEQKYEEAVALLVKSIFVCKLPSGITVDNYAARRAACSSAIRCS